jgi:hypothetical protein
MRPSKALYAASLWLLFTLSTASAQTTDRCSLPRDLQSQLATFHGGARVITVEDLEDDDRRYFEKDHGNACPGRTEVDFYGDGAPTLALVVNDYSGEKQRTELVLAHRVSDRWHLVSLETGDQLPNAPVVWSQPPGKYPDIYGEKTMIAKRPVIVFCKYEAWAIVYSWTGTRVDKVWISD